MHEKIPAFILKTLLTVAQQGGGK